MAEEKNHAVVPVFRVHSMLNKAASKEAGRPIYKDVEVCEIRMAGNRNTVGVFPAHEIWKWQDTPDGDREPITYAQRFSAHYQKFKASGAQAMSGTPLEELPFLTQGKRLELKALNIHTAEALAELDGQPLKNLGMGGRELKTQAQAYLDNAAKSADVTSLASENEALRQRLADMEAEQARLNEKKDASHDASASPFADEDDDTLKALIKEATGSAPRGNPSRATLIRMLDEALAEKEAEDKEAA